jgi:AcrR family transcriptional regulator
MPSDVAGTRARSKRPSPRERLLKAADELFYAEGINSVGIDRVIDRADVARASLYSTFGSKDELIRGYLEHRMEIIKAGCGPPPRRTTIRARPC